MTVEFKAWPKIPRLRGKGIIITEKIDGTNAVLFVSEDPKECVLAGSKSRWLTPENDNFGFARWVQENEFAVRKLGLGYHYGEWWGPGIQRGYGNKVKVLSLFNTWRHDNVMMTTGSDRIRTVPVLYEGPWYRDTIDLTMQRLDIDGSYACPGFYRPEGIVVYHVDSRQHFKYTFDGDKKEQA